MAELTYKASGHMYGAEARWKATASSAAQITRPGGGAGAFVGLIGLPPGYVNPVLTACTDG